MIVLNVLRDPSVLFKMGIFILSIFQVANAIHQGFGTMLILFFYLWFGYASFSFAGEFGRKLAIEVSKNKKKPRHSR